MRVAALFFLAGLVQTCWCSSIPVSSSSEKPQPVYQQISSSKSLDEKANSEVITKRLDNESERGGERRTWAREIVEISDPTTDSTLNSPHFPIDCTNEKECEALTGETTPMPTFRPYSQEELSVLLKKYVASNNGGITPDGEKPSNKLASLYMDEPVNVLENDKEFGKSKEKSKSWQLMQSQSHNHPYDDRTGWVTLEPVPWSASQIQKWEPNNRPPAIPQWGEQPTAQQAAWTRPNKWQDRPWNNKNTYEYKPSVKPPGWNDNYNSRPGSWPGDKWNGQDIITDGKPSHFPHEAAKPTWYERPHTEVVYHGEKDHPHSHPSDGDGRWVLLSSTKGYSMPQRSRAYQRALLVNANTPPSRDGTPSVKSHRSVRLTVLPPLNGTANTTTSHGGLLEVEQTFQTVDEAQREHAAKMMKLESLNKSTPSPSSHPGAPVAAKRSGTAVRVYPVRTGVDQARSNAVLAAVGAGMIPATVAMLLPMVLGRRRRSLPEPPTNAHPVLIEENNHHNPAFLHVINHIFP